MTNLRVLALMFCVFVCYNTEATNVSKLEQKVIAEKVDCNVILMAQGLSNNEEYPIDGVLIAIKITNPSGKVVYNAAGGNCIYTANLPEEGLYLIKITTETGTFVHEFLN